MGQLPAKESSSSRQSDPSSTSSQLASSSSSSHPSFPSLTSNKPSLPPLNLPSSFDGGKFEPQGVYPSAAQDYNHRVVQQAILNRRLSPFYKGSDDEDTYADQEENTECPICFLYYPSPLNLSRCCSQPICTECFVQIKRADPDHTNPPSTEPAACPFCMQVEFGITYIPPLSIREKILNSSKNSNSKSGNKVKISNSTSSNSNLNPNPSGNGSSAIGIDGELSGSAVVIDEESNSPDSPNSPNLEISVEQKNIKEKMRRKSFGANDPEVVTIDQIRPDFVEKLHLAQAAIARRANRRLIMRQVGDRLIPIGVTSGRMGAELNSRSEGPGGAIILREGERWGRVPGASGMGGGIQSINDVAASLAGLGGGSINSRRTTGRSGNGEEESRERERGGSNSRRRAEMERYLQGPASGADMEEMMLMEAMRLSLIEHEEQQKKQAEAEKAEREAKAVNETETSTNSSSQVKASTSSSTLETTSNSTSAPPRTTSSSTTTGGSQIETSPQTTVNSTSAIASHQKSPSTSENQTSSISSIPPTLPPHTSSTTSMNILSSNTMAELAELIDEGNNPRNNSTPQDRSSIRENQEIELPRSISQTQERTGSISAPAGITSSSRSSSNGFSPNQNSFMNKGNESPSISTSPVTNEIPGIHSIPSTSSFQFGSSSPASRSPPLPSSSSFTSRRINPNNPFRRGHHQSQSSQGNSPNHSRQNSNLSNGVDLLD